jgi:nucleoside transporter
MTTPSAPGLHPRLAAMFALQSMIMCAQAALLTGHMDALGFSGSQIGWVRATSALAAIVSPLVVGGLADRLFAAQKLLGACYLVCVPVLWLAWGQTGFLPILALMALYALAYQPTRGLANAIAFRHLQDRERFGHVRVWGTVGWIVVAWGLGGWLLWQEEAAPGVSHLGDGLLLGAGLAFIGAGLAFGLPDTAPTRRSGPGASPLAFVDALRLLRQPAFALLVWTVFLSSLLGPFLHNFTFIALVDPASYGVAASTATLLLSAAQVAEVPAMLLLASSVRRLGLRTTILAGVLCQTCRYFCFAGGDALAADGRQVEALGLVVFAGVLQGGSFAFFSTGAMMAVERLSPAHIRASAQSLLLVFQWGLGSLIGNALSGGLVDWLSATSGDRDWTLIFALPGLVAAVNALLFGLFFRPPAEDAT